MMSNTTGAIPPFPSQDLAKLVLGYLAEEQLMTAYDEFLQASPYLDAFQNEYDRIFMTSLRNIMAEYRAVKIYVETCCPFVLRRKLFQCSNLLEIVKFLVKHVDTNKLHTQEECLERGRVNRQHSFSKSNACDVCMSLKLPNCVCRTGYQSTSEIDESTLENSVMTTSLADLPGSSKKRMAKVPPAANNISHSISSSNQVKSIDVPEKCPDITCSSNLDKSGAMENVISSAAERNDVSNTGPLVTGEQSDSRQIVQGLNDILNLVSHNKNDFNLKPKDRNDGENVTCQRTGADTFEDIAAGADSSNIKAIVPDSSTSENIVLQSSTNETGVHKTFININKGSIGPQLLKINNENKTLILKPVTEHPNGLPRLSKQYVVKSAKRITEEHMSSKIKILSDVKVDNDIILPSVLKSGASTPLLQMQTLFINDTPVLKSTPQVHKNYTQDEIMAMPTIILVPSSSTAKKIVPTLTQSNTLRETKSPATTVTCTTNKDLGPLVIDVSPSDTAPSQIDSKMQGSSSQDINTHTNDDRLVKSVEVTSHMSLPKDNTLTDAKTTTPHVLPPTRKSSSTPRRTSHIRVLDFTTPRRILHETINEQGVNECPSNEVMPPATATLPLINSKNNEESLTKTSDISENVESNGEGSAKENKASLKVYNWDAKLRALACAGNTIEEKSSPIPRSKCKKSRRKVSPTDKKNCKSKDIKTSAKKITEKKNKPPETKSTKSNKNSLNSAKDTIDDKPIVTAIPVKPTINIISRDKWTDPIETDKSQNKSNNSDIQIETPELERMSLQNEIGAKLNISDFLETPYKQALYDIQMDTPKFLGPDLPDDPMSEIKIMNIPTPRFLNTPKVIQNTPSSYSSRPTDYSSGGSYYKPDDQDYVLATEVMECALSVNAETFRTQECSDIGKVNDEKISEGKSRPVRKCTKNVSYNYNSPSCSVKPKSVDDEKIEKSSTCSDKSISKIDKNVDKIKTPKSDTTKKENKVEPKKKSKKCKLTPKKEPPKTFMKIKPRRTTPVKEVLGKAKKRSVDHSSANYIKPVSKKAVATREKKVCFVPVVPVSTKSRRKSSTPRKLHCSKIFNTGSTVTNSPDRSKEGSKTSPIINVNVICNQDSDTDPLHWSDNEDEGLKPNLNEESANLCESDDIIKIKEYINRTEPNEVDNIPGTGTLQVDLIKRGFDVDTARMIERDLLETPTQNLRIEQQTIQNIKSISPPVSEIMKNDELETRDIVPVTKPDCSNLSNVEIVNEESDNDEFDLSVHDTNEDTKNYFIYRYDEAKFNPTNQVMFKDTFSMEICIEDEVAIRLRAMPLKTVFEIDEFNEEDCNKEDCNKKNLDNPKSPLRFDTLYTPRKAQCYEIFDSTLASLDTPLKPTSPKSQELETVTEILNVENEIVLEVEKLVHSKQKPESKKRKRVPSGTSDESLTGSKKLKSDTSYLLNSASIQNIDIESVLSKLHGP